MKQFFLAVSITILANAALHAQAKPKPKMKVVNPAATVAKPVSPLKNFSDSFSYALGLNIANNLKQQGIDKVGFTAMQRAMDDVFKSKPNLMNNDQANNCIQQQLQSSSAKKTGAVKSQGAAFLEANKKRPGVITLPDGLQYEVLKSGDANSARPRLQDTVVAHYAGTLIDGKKFDNSYDRGQPITIGVGGVISGWTEILQLMHIGDKWKVYIPSELGYGDRDAGANIPGGSTLIFEMELLGIIPGPAASETPKQN